MRVSKKAGWTMGIIAGVPLFMFSHNYRQPPDLTGQWTLTNFDRSNHNGNRTLDFHRGGRVTIMNIYAKFFRDGSYAFSDANHLHLNFKPGSKYPAETYEGTVQHDGLRFTLKNGTMEEYVRCDPDGPNSPPVDYLPAHHAAQVHKS